MKEFILIFIFMNVSVLAVAQGSWDLCYIPIDSLQNNLLGKEVRLDFKSSKYDTITGNVSAFKIRNLLSKSDLVILEIDGEKKEYIENWNFYVDHGILNDQILKEKNKSQQVKDIYIESISDSTIVVKMNFYKPEKCISQLKTLGSQFVEIDMRVIKGVLFRRN